MREYGAEVRAGDPRAAAARSILEFRGYMILEMTRIVVDTAGKQDLQSREAWRAAVGILGDLRAEEDAGLLAEQITVEFPGLPKMGARIQSRFPCAAALVAIGLRGLPSLMERAAATDEPRVLALCAVVTGEVLGNRLGAAYVQERIEAGGQFLTPVARERLGHVREYLLGDRHYEQVLRGE